MYWLMLQTCYFYDFMQRTRKNIENSFISYNCWKEDAKLFFLNVKHYTIYMCILIYALSYYLFGIVTYSEAEFAGNATTLVLWSAPVGTHKRTTRLGAERAGVWVTPLAIMVSV